MSAARYSQVLLAPWRQRDRASPWGRRIIAALLLVVGGASLVWLPPAAGWRVVVGLLLTIGLGAWMAVSYSLLEQNHPTAARTVPGHLPTLRRAALLGWALFTALDTVLLLLLVPAPGFWPLLLLCSGFLTAFLLWTTRLVWLWFLAILLSPLSIALGGWLAPARQALASLWDTHTYAVLAACLLLQAWLVLGAFANGNARHQARYATQVLMRRAMQMQMEGKAPAINSWAPFERLARPYARVLSAWLQLVLDRADNTRPRSVMARAEIVLHGQQHWLRYTLTMGTILAVVLMVFTLVLATTDAELGVVLKHGSFGMGIGIASAGLNPGLMLTSSLWASRREQALLCLLPGMPRGEALNIAIARLQWRDFIVGGLLTTALLFALGLAAGNQLLLSLPLAALPVAACMLTRRPALLRPPTSMTAVAPSFAFLTLAGLCHALAAQQIVPLWALGLVLAGVTAALLAWRWPQLAAAPAALPAGRLAA
ncbi:MAG TPA: hypothetical protein VGE36_02080 [Roseateles sp.]